MDLETHKLLIQSENSQRKLPLARPKNRWRVILETVVRELGYVREDWIQVAQDRVQLWAFINTVMDFRDP